MELGLNDVLMLGRIARGNVTWRYAGSGIGYRLWGTVPRTWAHQAVTLRVRPLVEAGLAWRGTVSGGGSGPVILTDEGSRLLAEARAATS